MLESLNGISLYLDSNSVIYAVEGGTPWTARLRRLLHAIDTGGVTAISSELTLAEILVKPIEKRAGELIAHYQAMFSEGSPLQAVGVDRSILIAAARLRASNGIKLIDAVHIATADALGCSHFLSNDVRLFGSLPTRMAGVRPADLPAP